MKKHGTAPPFESVWDYPRPPRLEACAHQVRVEFNGVTVAKSVKAYRLLETSHPPTYYIPPADIATEYLRANPRLSFCEYKGEARYWDLSVDLRTSSAAGWSYPHPADRYLALRDHLAFYSDRVDACFVDDERVQPQAGDFYGGWITSKIKGPFKGGPGTAGW